MNPNRRIFCFMADCESYVDVLENQRMIWKLCYFKLYCNADPGQGRAKWWCRLLFPCKIPKIFARIRYVWRAKNNKDFFWLTAKDDLASHGRSVTLAWGRVEIRKVDLGHKKCSEDLTKPPDRHLVLVHWRRGPKKYFAFYYETKIYSRRNGKNISIAAR